MIRFETRGPVGLATIDRQERRNALSGELCDELRTQLDAHRDLRAIVITGAGSAFCSGADLVTRFEPAESASDVPVDSFRPAFELVLEAIVDHPAPVIAAINGPAMGAGMQLAVACDLRVAVRGARMAIPGGRLGVHLSGRNIWRLAMLVGQGAATSSSPVAPSTRRRRSGSASSSASPTTPSRPRSWLPTRSRRRRR